ncbi:MAG: UbiX family flavin prenyltransferase [Candidatus Omnitrophica bacterium]|nr:UbiX family flavin prenyltransferase [Candidatus Omnitrophota bacterium]
MMPLIVGITGASGVLYAVRMVQMLTESGISIALVISEAARLVFKEELGISLKSYTREEDLIPVFGEKSRGLLTAYSAKDFSAPIASGSYPTRGMVIIPCSMGTLGALAAGMSQNLIHRAADCVIKEGRRLVLVPRETPLSAIHLENMLKLARLGVRVVPAMPGFYSGIQSVQDLVDFMVGKVLDQLDISHTLYPRWTGPIHKTEGTLAHGE